MRGQKFSAILSMKTFTSTITPPNIRHSTPQFVAIISCALGYILVMFAASRACAQSPISSDEFISIFDGQTLDGWEAAPTNSAADWTARDGMIVGQGSKTRSYLIYIRNRELSNFELRFKYRLPGNGNTGVSIRASVDSTQKRDFQCYHADIGHLGIGRKVLGAWDFHTPGRTEHRCYQGDSLVIDADDQPTITPIKNGLRDEDIQDRDWNEAHIVAKDNYFKFSINGKLASEFTEHLPVERRLLKGMLQLQLHDPGMTVHFKDVRLRILK